MCNVCCKEFQGWCRAFTATEVILSALQAILLTLFVAFLTFLILHLVTCSDQGTGGLDQGKAITQEGVLPPETASPEHAPTTHRALVAPDVACTWTPSAKTTADTQYFEQADILSVSDVAATQTVTPGHDDHTGGDNNSIFDSDGFDGEPANNEKTFIMALVKMKPPNDVSYGCILTIISESWTLTAASCIESIEEVDSLDSFVMMENFGEPRHGRTHPVSDVLIHPQYQGTNRSYDVAALKSGDKLGGGDALPTLPSMLDYMLITIGERLTILGYGKFRSINRESLARAAHAVAVHVLPRAECAARQEAWSARHLAGGAPAERAGCGAAALCAGPLHARGLPCNYCAGTPLLRGRLLLGLMREPAPCGAPCDPALYVNLAAAGDWLNSVLSSE